MYTNTDDALPVLNYPKILVGGFNGDCTSPVQLGLYTYMKGNFAGVGDLK